MRYASLPPAQPRAARRSVEMAREFSAFPAPAGMLPPALEWPPCAKAAGGCGKEGLFLSLPAPRPPKKAPPRVPAGQGRRGTGREQARRSFSGLQARAGAVLPRILPGCFFAGRSPSSPQKGPSPRSRKLLSLQGASPLARGAFLPSRLSVPFLHGIFAGPFLEGGSAVFPGPARGVDAAFARR